MHTHASDVEKRRKEREGGKRMDKLIKRLIIKNKQKGTKPERAMRMI